MFRKIIQITAWDSPNVQEAEREIAEGRKPSGRVVIPGVLTYEELQERLATWDEIRKKIGLHAEFPEETELLLWPETWLKACWARWRELQGARGKRVAKAMGIDVGEGGANSTWCVGDELGILELDSIKTPNTNVIPTITCDKARRWSVPADRWVFDRGGGGKHQADRLRAMGFHCQTVAFNDKPQVELKRGLVLIEERREVREDKSIYANVRVQMHDEAAQLCDPGAGRPPYAIAPPEQGLQWDRLWRQMRVIPKEYDDFGKMVLPPKDELAATYWNSASPDELDAYILMVFGLTHRSRRAIAGAV